MPGEESTEPEFAQFVDQARAAVRGADPPPAIVTEFAKLAFQFRHVETVDFSEHREMAAVRSNGTSVTHRVERGDTTLIWSVEGDRINGVVHASTTPVVSVQTVDGWSEPEIDADGAFEGDSPRGPYRLVIRGEDRSWATPWSA